MGKSISVTEKDILEFIKKELLMFPNGVVCKHHIAAGLLSMMEGRGWSCPIELAESVVGCDDEVAISIIDNM